jgi:hypothetical protein
MFRERGYTIEVASSRDSNYNQFVKLVRTRNGLDMHMDVFSFDELCSIRGEMTVEEVMFRHMIVGGSAKLPLNIDVLPFVQDIISWFFESTNFLTQFPDTYLGYCRFISEQLQKETSDQNKVVMNSVLRHTLRGTGQPASNVMNYCCRDHDPHGGVIISGIRQDRKTQWTWKLLRFVDAQNDYKKRI